MSPTPSRRQRLLADVDWTGCYMAAVIADTRRAGAEVPIVEMEKETPKAS